MRDFRQLKVWEKAHLLTLRVYKTTLAFPNDEHYSLTSQVRRSASSIPSNIAEGCGRDGEAELARFMRIAMGSASELEYQMLLAHDLAYLSDDEYESIRVDIEEVKRMLAGFLAQLRADR